MCVRAAVGPSYFPRTELSHRHAAPQSDCADSLGDIEGKICCPKCSARLGSYNWAGAQCSCGAWVAPAVQVIKSKVDESSIPPRAQR